MKVVLLAFLALLVGAAHAAEDTEDLTRELVQYQRDAAKVLRQIQERTAGLDGGRIREARAKAMILAGDERFLSSVTDLWNHPKRNMLLWVDGLFLVLMFFVKAWRQAKAKNWFTKILVGFFLGLFTWVSILLVIPYLVLGEPFKVVVATLWRVFTA